MLRPALCNIKPARQMRRRRPRLVISSLDAMRNQRAARTNSFCRSTTRERRIGNSLTVNRALSDTVLQSRKDNLHRKELTSD